MGIDDVYKKLEIIERMLSEQNLLKKDVLNLIEAAVYLDISESHLYKLTSTGLIPFYKPNGKKVYFNRCELDRWLLTNRRVSHDEIETLADDYLIRNSKRRF